MNHALRQTLLSMVDEDEAVRSALAATGELHDGYAPSMAEVHARNAAALERIIEDSGWPHREIVGDDGAAAAWLVLQHAIANPSLQRRCLPILKQHASAGRIDPAAPAYLEDRIRFFEGRPQLYGTQHDWDDAGTLSPGEIEDPGRVDERRASIGLGPLAEATAKIRQRTRDDGEQAPEDLEAHRKKAAEWARSVGWR